MNDAAMIDLGEHQWRIPRLAGGRNFRDMGGYQTTTGRLMKRGQLFRSGSMAGITDTDGTLLGGLGIRMICDLRTSVERDGAPCRWHDQIEGLRYWARDYGMSFGELHRKQRGDAIPDEAWLRESMMVAYRHLPFEQAPAYKELFACLSNGEVPLVFNCTAGKDRTGIAAALVLAALDVPRAVILEDYMLTQLTLGHIPRSELRSVSSRIPDALARVVLGVDEAYLTESFVTIENRYGDIETYLFECLGVDAGALERLREHLLEPAGGATDDRSHTQVS